MERLKQFFSCCTRQNKEDEIYIIGKKRNINKNCSSQPAKTFIKRSIGKNPILDLSFKKNTVSTSITLGGTSTNRARHKNNQDRSIQFPLELSASFDLNTKHIPSNIESFRYSPLPQNNKQDREEPMDCEINRFQEEDKEQYIYKPKEIRQLINLKQIIPINNFLERKNRFRHIKANKNPKKDNGLLKYYKKGLDTIDERSSIPSIDQYNEARHISSKATLKLSQDYQKNRSKQFSKSLILSGNNALNMFSMMNSQNLPKNNQNTQELQKMLISKLQGDVNHLQRQLQNLNGQEKALNQKRIFVKKKQTQQMQSFSSLKLQLSRNIVDRQRQMQQIKNIISQKSKISY